MRRINFNFRIPEDPRERKIFYNRCCVCIVCVLIGIFARRYFSTRGNLQVKQPESPIISETPEETPETPEETPETLEPMPTPTPSPTPTPEVTPQPTLPPLPEENPPENQQDFEFPKNLTHEQLNCLKYGGGKSCFADQYQPQLPESTHPRQLPPVLPDLPDSQFGQEPNPNNIAIAVISGREVKDWTPDYNLAPMSPGVCPPSWVIAYQGRLFCDRRLILEAIPPLTKFRRYQEQY